MQKKMIKKCLNKPWESFMKTLAFLGLLVMLTPEIIAADEEKMAFQLATLFRSSRAVVTKNKALITDPIAAKAGKSTSAFVDDFLKKTKKIYRRSTGASFPKVDSTPLGEARGHLIESIKTIIGKAVDGGYSKQFMYTSDAYYKPGAKKYDDKFLPARYATEVMNEFSKRTGGRILLKLTAPKKYLVKKSNEPDAFENKVMESIFSKSGYEKGAPYTEQTKFNGMDAFRQVIPEYYKKGCIGCHGSAAGQDGANIHMSGVGATKGEIGGAISIVIIK
jgi:hypothetical protein